MSKLLEDDVFKYQCPKCRETNSKNGSSYLSEKESNGLLKKKRNTQKATSINCNIIILIE